MRAHQIMTKDVITVTPSTPVLKAANIMLKCNISGLPIVDEMGILKGIVSEGDFLRRSEIGTGPKHTSWLDFFTGAGHLASEFVHEHGRKVKDVMTADPITVGEDTSLEELVRLMEKNGIKRLPVMRGKALVGIVTRSNILQAVASMAREIPDPTADDDHIRDRIMRQLYASDWCPASFQVMVRNGIVHLHGIIFDDRTRRATIVAAENTAGVREVHDHLCFVDTHSGFYMESPEDMAARTS